MSVEEPEAHVLTSCVKRSAASYVPLTTPPTLSVKSVSRPVGSYQRARSPIAKPDDLARKTKNKVSHREAPQAL